MLALHKNIRPSGDLFKPTLWKSLITEDNPLDTDDYKKVTAESNDPIRRSPLLKEYVNNPEYQICKSSELIFGRYSLVWVPEIDEDHIIELAVLFLYDRIADKSTFLLCGFKVNEDILITYLNRATGEVLVDDTADAYLEYIRTIYVKGFNYNFLDTELEFNTVVTCSSIVMLCRLQPDVYCIKSILFKRTVVSSGDSGSENITITEYPMILTKKQYCIDVFEINLATRAFRNLLFSENWQAIKI